MVECTNEVTQMVPRGYGYVEAMGWCGQTGYTGQPVYCGECREIYAKRGYAKHQCPHGIDFYPEDGRDIPCWRCESDEEE